MQPARPPPTLPGLHPGRRVVALGDAAPGPLHPTCSRVPGSRPLAIPETCPPGEGEVSLISHLASRRGYAQRRRMRRVDVAQLVLDYLKVLAWPAILFLSFLLFRNSINELIRRLRSAKVAGAEASFEGKIESAAYSVEEAKAELTQPRSTTVKSASESRANSQLDGEGDVFHGGGSARERESNNEDDDELDLSSDLATSLTAGNVPNVGYVITHSELSRIRHPSRGTLLGHISRAIGAIGLPRPPRFTRISRGGDEWRRGVSDVWSELERYLDGLCYAVVLVLISDELDDHAKRGMREAVDRYRSGAFPEDLIDRVGRWLSLRSISAVSIGISNLREIEEEVLSSPPPESNTGLGDKYRSSCQGVVDVLDVIFRGGGVPDSRSSGPVLPYASVGRSTEEEEQIGREG